MTVKFTVPGAPRGKQRPRTVRNKATGKTMTYTPKQTVEYENLVKSSYIQQCKGKTLNGAIEAKITAYFPIPKSTGKKVQELMIAGKILHAKKSDIDNIMKCLLDSLNKIAYHDDAQVARVYAEKKYSTQPRVEVILSEIELDISARSISSENPEGEISNENAE